MSMRQSSLRDGWAQGLWHGAGEATCICNAHYTPEESSRAALGPLQANTRTVTMQVGDERAQSHLSN